MNCTDHGVNENYFALYRSYHLRSDSFFAKGDASVGNSVKFLDSDASSLSILPRRCVLRMDITESGAAPHIVVCSPYGGGSVDTGFYI